MAVLREESEASGKTATHAGRAGGDHPVSGPESAQGAWPGEEPAEEPAVEDGGVLLVELERLDSNPFQPRSRVDAAALAELMASIRACGVIQPVVVRPEATGRFTMVAGHRRVEACRRLRDRATSEDERARFDRVPACIRSGLGNPELAALAYVENVSRCALTAVEEGRALERMLDEGLAQSSEELASMTGQPLVRVRRLRRVARAPSFIREAMEVGCLVPMHGERGNEGATERRLLELMPALQFQSLYEHLQRLEPDKAEARVVAILRRAMAGRWSLRRIEATVKAATCELGEASGVGRIEETAAQDETIATHLPAAPDGAKGGTTTSPHDWADGPAVRADSRAAVSARAGGTEGADGVPDVAVRPRQGGVFERTERRFIVMLEKLATASSLELAALREAFEDVVEGCSRVGGSDGR